MRTINPRILYFGTPVVLLSSENPDGTANLAPMSSAWALGHVVVLGIGGNGQTARNLRARPDVVINLPGPSLWPAVERLAPLTGRFPVPPDKRAQFRSSAAKFAEAGLTPVPSTVVRPPRVAECPLQLEARVRAAHEAGFDAERKGGPDDGFLIAEAEVLRVHADDDLIVPGTEHIDPAAWQPLIYNFRHYFGLGDQLGHTYRSETPESARAAVPGPVR